MEQLHNGYTLELSEGAFPLSTDSVALSGFVKLSKNANVLDLGSGCGTLGLLLCSRWDDCCVTGIELDEQAHQMALQNARNNRIEHRLNSICADVGHIHTFVKAGTYSSCVSNPPYFSGGPVSQATPLARSEQTLDPEVLFRAAAWALKFGGDFYLVHRPERFGELCRIAGTYKLEAKRLCLLRHQSDGPVALILLQFRKGAKPGLTWEEASLHDPSGIPTPYYRELYHLQEG